MSPARLTHLLGTCETPPQPATRDRRAVLRGVLAILLACVSMALWLIELRPQYMGGLAGYVTIAGTSMEPGLSSGDVVMVHRQESYGRGDVVAYRVPKGQPGAGRVVIHRIVGGSAAQGYILRGDNRDANDAWRPKPADVIGRQRARVPGLGRAARLLLSPIGLGTIAGLIVMTLLLTAPVGRDRP